jgi:hypothetical protein
MSDTRQTNGDKEAQVTVRGVRFCNYGCGMDERGQIKAKREAAAQARRLSLGLTRPADQDRVLVFAAELEARADALERAMIVSSPAPRGTQVQQATASAHEKPKT